MNRRILIRREQKRKEILGVAGASDDTDHIWQIGVDVVSGKRKIPYYGTAWSNIASKRVAINAGYKPVWVELKAMKR